MRDQKVQALREAGFLVAVEVYIRTISYDDARGYAIADYISTVPNSGVFIIGEIKTGDASLVPRQSQHFRSGLIQIIGRGGIPVGLPPGAVMPAVYLEEDRFPGCPA